jgi:hypothetical protein
MTRKEINSLVANISKEKGIPMQTVQDVLASFLEYSRERSATPAVTWDPLLFGSITLDQHIPLNPGITLISGHADIGKTSLAKRIAVAAEKQGMNVVYYDVECKMHYHDLSPLRSEGIVFANSYRDSGLKHIVANGIVDVMIVDTVTSLYKNAQHLFLTKARRSVPYVILLSQMRMDIKKNKSVPAVTDQVMSSSHTHIHLTGRETITIESIDMCRVQFEIGKYEADRTLQGKRDSFIIRDNIVDNLYSAYDHIKSDGRVQSVGRDKYIDGEFIGPIKALKDDQQLVDKILTLFHEEVPVDVYHNRESLQELYDTIEDEDRDKAVSKG